MTDFNLVGIFSRDCCSPFKFTVPLGLFESSTLYGINITNYQGFVKLCQYYFQINIAVFS